MGVVQVGPNGRRITRAGTPPRESGIALFGPPPVAHDAVRDSNLRLQRRPTTLLVPPGHSTGARRPTAEVHAACPANVSMFTSGSLSRWPPAAMLTFRLSMTYRSVALALAASNLACHSTIWNLKQGPRPTANDIEARNFILEPRISTAVRTYVPRPIMLLLQLHGRGGRRFQGHKQTNTANKTDTATWEGNTEEGRNTTCVQKTLRGTHRHR